MQEPLEIVFHNLPSSEAVEAAIRERFAKLEKLYDRLPQEFMYMRELILSALWRSPEHWRLEAEV